MPNFLSPEISVVEIQNSVTVAKRISPSISAIMGSAERGPVNRPQGITSLDDFEAIYGKDNGGPLYQSLIGFFNNGGERAIINRVEHYTDITDIGTLTCESASLMLLTDGDADTAATKTTGDGPWDLSPANGVAQPPTLIASINGNPDSTLTIACTPSVLTAAGDFVGAAAVATTATFSLMGVNILYTTPNPAPTTKEALALDIASQIPGIFGGLTGNKIKLTTDEQGSLADLDYVSSTGNFGVQSGFGAGPTAGVNAGPNDIPRRSLVTATQLAPLVDAAWTAGTGVVSTVDGDAFSTSTVDVGATASISAVTGTAAAVINFSPGGLVEGIDAGSPGVNTINAIATSEGEHGNNLAITTKRVDKVVAKITADMLVANAPFDYMTVDNKSQLRVGLQVYVNDAVNNKHFRAVIKRIIGFKIYFETAVTPTGNIQAANTPTVTKETFNFTVTVDGDSSKIKVYNDLSMSELDANYFAYVIGNDPKLMDPTLRVYVDDQDVAYSNSVDPRPVDVTLSALTGGVDGDALVNLDITGSLSNNTGLYALDSNTDFSLTGVPGFDNAEVHKALMDYAESRKDHVAIMDVPTGQTPAQSVTYKNTTANIYSTYAVMQVGRIRVRRASSGQIESFPNIGYVLGMFARNDRENNVSEVPAGNRKGRLRGVLDIDNNNEYQDKKKRDIVYPEGLNTIFASEVGAIYFGQNLTNPLSEISGIGVRRAFLFIGKSVNQISQFVLFEKNTMILRRNFSSVVEGFLDEQWRKGVLDGDTSAQAYKVECDSKNNPPQLIAAKGFYARVLIHVLPGIEYGLVELQKMNESLLD